MSANSTRSVTDPDRLAALEEERDFLLRSLDDLDREHAVGDVSDDDYHVLRDDYTARAAITIRAIEQRTAALAPRRPFNWRRLALNGVAALGIAAAITVALVNATAERNGAESPTGGLPNSEPIDARVVEGQALMQTSPFDAVQLFETVLSDPAASKASRVAAHTWYGWTLYLTSRQMPAGAEAELLAERSAAHLEDAIAADDDAADPHCFLAIVRFRTFNDAKAARPLFDTCVAAGPSPNVAPLLSAFETDLIEAENS